MCYRMRADRVRRQPGVGVRPRAPTRPGASATTAPAGRTSSSAPGLAANLVGLEVVKLVTGVTEPSLLGQILTIRLTDLTIERHTVLRKPWCPGLLVAGARA